MDKALIYAGVAFLTECVKIRIPSVSRDPLHSNLSHSSFSSAVVAQTSGNLMRFKDRIVFGQEEPIEQVRIFDDRTKVRVDLGIENSTSR